MTKPSRALAALMLMTMSFAAAAAAPGPVDVAALEQQLRDAETAFAKSMADRDLQAFGGFIAEDAVFVNGRQPLRGKTAILAAWAGYFEGEQAPFAWAPETVVVLDSGRLGQTKGPVTGPDGQPVLEFRSTWRRDDTGRWQVVFDDGACRCAPPPAGD
ncbi:MAG TPA: nuclear transport factor 2 family protein [Arenimonas sp.]|uniref:YybH family protein n=1 Tax=Arenimonas sp. TaxID=1872635 RepID=UPI002D7EB5B3|nr:nuclear transport factor 2 family protein [Arenimonas sp.]HEU0152811.1 nuclear transport factor 2 family protein [Arenimonas sp.]